MGCVSRGALRGSKRDSTIRHGTDNNSPFLRNDRLNELPSRPRAKVKQDDSIVMQLTPIVGTRETTQIRVTQDISRYI